MADSSSQETVEHRGQERSWRTLLAVLPTVAFLIGIGAYALNVRPMYVEIFRDFGVELPQFTQFLLRASPFLFVGPPVFLSLVLLWSAWKRSTTTMICLSVGCLALGFFSAAILHISFVAPLISLVQNLA